MLTSFRLATLASFLTALAVGNRARSSGSASAAITTACRCAAAGRSPGQNGGPATHPVQHGHGVATGGVAIVDLSYVLKNHAGFNQRLEELRREAEAAQADLTAKRDAVQKLIVQLDDFQRGSPDYKKLEEEITKRQANLQVDLNITKKKFAETEAKVYYEAYQQVAAEIKSYADAAHINLVLKFNGDPVNKDSPEEIQREMLSLVLYYNQAIDITPIVLERLKGQPGRQGPAPSSAQRPGVPPHAARSNVDDGRANVTFVSCFFPVLSSLDEPDVHSTTATHHRNVGGRRRLWILERSRRPRRASACAAGYGSRIRPPRSGEAATDRGHGGQSSRDAAPHHATRRRR